MQEIAEVEIAIMEAVQIDFKIQKGPFTTRTRDRGITIIISPTDTNIAIGIGIRTIIRVNQIFINEDNEMIITDIRDRLNEKTQIIMGIEDHIKLESRTIRMNKYSHTR